MNKIKTRNKKLNQYNKRDIQIDIQQYSDIIGTNNRLSKQINNKMMREYNFFGDIKSKLNIQLITNYFDIDYADKLFNALTKINFNPSDESMIKIFGKTIPIPREQTAYGKLGTTYHFSGIHVGARDWDIDIDDDTTEGFVARELKYIAGVVGDTSCATFNYALINRYKTGKNYIGYHSDDEAELGERPLIAGISLGQDRQIYFKSNITHEVVKINLPHNSLVIMNFPTNKYWKHSIPMTSKKIGERISLTFRNVDQNQNTRHSLSSKKTM